jgi:hypothetical protein
MATPRHEQQAPPQARRSLPLAMQAGAPTYVSC